MERIKNFTANPYLFILLFLFPFFTGGYYTFYCAGFSILLTASIVYNAFNNKKITIYKSFSVVVIAVITILYIVTAIWAVDSSMALTGSIKYICAFLFCINIWQIDEKERTKLFRAIPLSAVIMTILSVVCGMFDSIKYRFYDNAGDLNGTFEYANTYALFLLVGALVLVFDNKNKILSSLGILILTYGIFASNSRGVWLLGILAIFVITVLLLYVKKGKKTAVTTVVSIVIVIAIAGILLVASGGAKQIANYIITDGSLNERLLYYHDGLLYVLKHPFGKGAYAFYYAQSQLQSAYYYAIDVHCDILQLGIEVGFIPAIMFAVLIVTTLFSKKVSLMQRTILLFVVVHSLIDYDLQFCAIIWIVILCLPYHNKSHFNINSNLIFGIIATTIIAYNSIIGLSCFYNYIGQNEKAVKYFSNTSSLIILMESTNDQQTAYNYANKILKINSCVFEPNDVLANVYMANEKYENALEQIDIALEKNPRDMDIWREYVDLCIKAKNYYQKNNNTQAANDCLKRIKSVPNRIEEIKKNTSKRAIKYGRTQDFDLGGEYTKKIENCQ